MWHSVHMTNDIDYDALADDELEEPIRNAQREADEDYTYMTGDAGMTLVELLLLVTGGAAIWFAVIVVLIAMVPR